MNVESCTFCRILKENSRSDIVAENAHCFAIVPRQMASRGHLLVIPKLHVSNIFDIPDDTLREVISFARALSKSLEKQSNVSGINLLHASGESAQQSVAHFHMHLLPRSEGDGINAWPQLPGSQQRIEVMHEIIDMGSK